MFQDRDRVMEALGSGFGGRAILVVGDLMLDGYLWGDVKRISPEAPAPVVRVLRETETCGGAANVALNLALLGLQPIVAGLVGADPQGERLQNLLRENGCRPDAVVAITGWPTIQKTRVLGGHQQMMRLDREEPLIEAESALQSMMDRVELALDRPGGVGAILLSDYGKGTLSPSVCQTLIQRGKALGVPVLADPKGRDFSRYRGATLISPNRSELGDAVGASGEDLQDLEALLTAGESLRREQDTQMLAVTLSEQGIALLDGVGPPRRLPAMAREVFDVSGAGDTVIAALAAGLAAGLDPWDVLHLANLAAGVVVGKVGTTPISRSELVAALDSEEALDQSGKIASLEAIAAMVSRWRARGERVVFTNGCFDLIHAGHVTYLEKARRLGNRLVVGLNTDRSVRELKGPKRPLIQENDRARVLAALASVDAVILFDEPTPLRLIEALRPDILAKGADYSEDQVVGGLQVKSWGGRVALVPLVEGRSTTRIVNEIQAEPDAG